jgi:hypothetical protein
VELLLSQKNSVFETITISGFNPSDFRWDTITRGSDRRREDFPVLRYRNSPYYYEFESSGGEHSPGSSQFLEAFLSPTWDLRLESIRRWLTYLEREVNQPDYWANIQRNVARGMSIGPLISNEPFSAVEKEKIKSGLERLPIVLIEREIVAPNDLEYLEEQMNYMIAASDRMGKKDWGLLFLGTIISMAQTLALEPNKASSLWQIAKELFFTVLKLLT